MHEAGSVPPSQPADVNPGYERQPLVLYGWPFLAALWWVLAVAYVLQDGWSWGEPLFVFAWVFAVVWTLFAFIVVRRHRRITAPREANSAR